MNRMAKDGSNPTGSSGQVADTNPPRLAETAGGLWEAIKMLSGGVATSAGLIYPTARVVCGEDHQVRQDGSVWVISDAKGITSRPATVAERESFKRDIDLDRVLVVLLSRPGYGSDYGSRKVLQVLHSPAGGTPGWVDEERAKELTQT